ncbi:MAG: hypothetical protein KF781_10705 [Chitinophagaceae bacterium]|nr:hypothetical protein [Chitinophagaceae bacterium]MCW5906130.1 hypothetical protein [Chitinophagaceae bacterium]
MAKRGLSTEGARNVRQKGHDDALAFALSIGLDSDYKNDIVAKKDVIDPSGDAHSVKSGVKKGQLFLYGINRFQTDDFFQTMNGIGQLLVKCIESFPPNFEDYEKNKQLFKEKCRIPMRELKELLQEKRRVRSLINKSMFNGGEVNYLTVKDNNRYHVFLNKDVVTAFADAVIVENSKAITASQTPEQKVIFKFEGKNLAELEMRNDSKLHYRQIRFNMLKPRMMALLFEKIPHTATYSDKVLIYGNASKKFGKWKPA